VLCPRASPPGGAQKFHPAPRSSPAVQSWIFLGRTPLTRDETGGTQVRGRGRRPNLDGGHLGRGPKALESAREIVCDVLRHKGLWGSTSILRGNSGAPEPLDKGGSIGTHVWKGRAGPEPGTWESQRQPVAPVRKGDAFELVCDHPMAFHPGREARKAFAVRIRYHDLLGRER
jgi:hypothetical protein